MGRNIGKPGRRYYDGEMETTKTKKGSSVKRSSTNLRVDGTWMTSKNQTANSEPVNADVVSFPVVGIGASAGRIEAFTLLLQHLPPDTGMGFVMVQHLDPVHESVLTKLLSKRLQWPCTRSPTICRSNLIMFMLFLPTRPSASRTGF